MILEEFLKGLRQIDIFGASPLAANQPLTEFAISINGRRPGAYAAAINNSGSDQRRVKDWPIILVPNPAYDVAQPSGAIVHDPRPRW